ncbi:hypothetical protein FBY03_113106 [Pseudomonas sp. SJZ079]|nr:hypothetical protein FBY03_113106 [Pseudomonas sp. SJZ079]
MSTPSSPVWRTALSGNVHQQKARCVQVLLAILRNAFVETVNARLERTPMAGPVTK